MTILFEDQNFLAINKPSGVVVNNADTVHTQTVQSWAKSHIGLADYTGEVSGEVADEEGEYDYERMFLERSGVVHRLDKETSGVLLIGKTVESFKLLQQQFKNRETKKEYRALVHDIVHPPVGEISVPVGRLTWNRKQFGVVAGGREAVTRYETEAIYERKEGKLKLHYTYLHLFPLTGRTHQIRVHMKHIHHPVVSDTLYAGRKTAMLDRKALPRLFLHAYSLTFFHPITRKEQTVVAPLPSDLTNFLDTCLRIQ